MPTLQERIANERRRLRLVRLKMVGAIEDDVRGDKTYVPFYVAAADYIDATMQRLHHQDVKMRDMIVEKVGEVDDSVEQALSELDARLEGAKAHLKPFLEARDGLTDKGVEALEAFEKIGKEYSDFIVANMGHHGATADLAAKLFSPGDWEYMAGITDEQQAEDENLFQRVVDLAPDTVKHISA
ncbi:MAG: hypothetical protein KJO76_00215 [Gammaproteobacteria bacterium]|nr:hypothetical protein [Gammaproteobacteria bacterium]MBT8443158.1 hypothetical protein [Gammaproteobacteria bacterium]NND36089.1 hypothetical protein [Gammaproteobacteria bacterium]